MTVHFTVPGEPEGKARPRVTSRGTYTPPKTKTYEQLVRMEYRRQCKDAFFASRPLSVSIRSYHKIPQSAAKRQRERMLSDKTWPTKKPDADNIAKAVLDSLNCVAYTDDAQVICLDIVKHWDTVPRVEVWITDDITPQEGDT